MSNDFWEGELIYSYSRKQAIEDGILVECSPLAKEAGFKFPVAVTRELWDSLIVPDKNVGGGQSEEGRLWDVLNVLRWSIRITTSDMSVIEFDVSFLMKNEVQKVVTLKSVCGPDDDASPCITIMFPHED